MLRRYPHREAGIAAALIFGPAGLLLGAAAASVAPELPAWVLAPIVAVVGSVVAFFSFASVSDRRPPIAWQAAAADGTVAGITGGIVVAFVVALMQSGAGTSSGPSVSGVAADVGVAVLVGAVGGSILGMLTFLLAGPGRMNRLPPRAPRRRRRNRSARKSK